MQDVGLGIDIGGSGIKAAFVDVTTGAVVGERVRLPTPQPATPAAVANVVADVCHLVRAGEPGVIPIARGAAFPAVVHDGITRSAANVDEAWIGERAEVRLSEVLGAPVQLINDADAAGLAEVGFGAARDVAGVVLVLTLGTGIGSALFVDGRLVPNTELGHLAFRGHTSVEDWVSDRARRVEGLSWKRWVQRLDAYLRHLVILFSPRLIVLGGGVSKRFEEKIAPRLEVDVHVTAAALRNDAGIVGAAWYAAQAAAR
jgi:polyphosphate glucokinase